MPILRNCNPLGQVDLPLLGRQGDALGTPGVGCLEPGEEFEVSDEQARTLLMQVGNYEPADAAAKEIFDGLTKESLAALSEAATGAAEAQQALADTADAVSKALTDHDDDDKDAV